VVHTIVVTARVGHQLHCARVSPTPIMTLHARVQRTQPAATPTRVLKAMDPRAAGASMYVNQPWICAPSGHAAARGSAALLSPGKNQQLC